MNALESPNDVDDARTTFRAMGCRVSVFVNGPASLSVRARSSIQHLEQLWSRFIVDSDISLLNDSNGRPRRVDPMTVRLIRAMIGGWNETDGAFDPTLLPTLVALGGDDRSENCSRSTLVPDQLMWRGDPGSIEIDADGTVTLPACTTLDPGGIGKGLAADIVAGELSAAGAVGVLIDIGGDIAVRGLAPSGDGWKIAVGDEGEAVALCHGGVATSGIERRRWTRPDGVVVHHLIDPRHLAPFTTEACEVSVIAGTAAWAEVFTKYVMAASARGRVALDDALSHLDSRGLAARVRHRTGEIDRNQSWTTFDAARRTA
jgi:FAD:protein FMN transferase